MPEFGSCQNSIHARIRFIPKFETQQFWASALMSSNTKTDTGRILAYLSQLDIDQRVEAGLMGVAVR